MFVAGENYSENRIPLNIIDIIIEYDFVHDVII